MFAGSLDSLHNGRKNLIKYLMSKKINLKLLGRNRHERIYDSEHNKACNCAKICLSHNAWPNIECSSSVRIYKIIASKSFCLEQYSKNMSNYLNNKLITYNTNDDCYNKIIYYLNNEKERRKVVEESYKEVIENHKYIDRMKQVIVDINNLKI